MKRNWFCVVFFFAVFCSFFSLPRLGIKCLWNVIKGHINICWLKVSHHFQPTHIPLHTIRIECFQQLTTRWQPSSGPPHSHWNLVYFDSNHDACGFCKYGVPVLFAQVNAKLVLVSSQVLMWFVILFMCQLCVIFQNQTKHAPPFTVSFIWLTICVQHKEFLIENCHLSVESKTLPCDRYHFDE